MKKDGLGFGLGFFLVSLVLLYLEILVTRIFSLILWHNLAYLVISMALLGIGAAGVWDSVFAGKRKRNPGWFAILAGLSLVLIFRWGSNSDFQFGRPGIRFLLENSGLIFFPFFFLGLILVRVFAGRAEAIGRVYAINLIASAAGVILALTVLKPLGMPKALMLACLVLGLGAFLFSLGSSRALKAAAVVWIIFSLSGYLWAERWFQFQVTSTKSFGKFQKLWPDFKLEFSRWDPLGRVDAFSSSRSWITYGDQKAFYRALTIDGAADTTLITLSKSQGATFMPSTEYGQAFVLYGKTPEKVLVIGVGGAPDLEAALSFESGSVTGVEVNGSVLEAVRKFLPEVATDPRVRLIHSDGRSYVARSRESFDLIQISGVDTISALQWGAYIQAENYIHTVEAYEEYLKHLKPDGILSIGLIEMHPARNMLRSCVLTVEAMRRLGIGHPEDNIILVQQAQYIQMLARKKAFRPEELARYQAELAANNPTSPVTFEFRFLFNQIAEMWVRYAPGVGKPDDNFANFFSAVKAGTEKEFIRGYVLDISPVTDDRPFFYKYYYWPFLSFSSEAFAGPVLWLQFFEAVGFAIIFIVFPLLWLSPGSPLKSGISRRVPFFLFIGLGYMMIEIPMIQRFALYLGHPTYALALVLGVLLFCSGIGSWLYQKFFSAREWVIWVAVAGIVLVNLLGIKLAPLTLAQTISQSFATRALVTASWAGLLGLFMGIPFPAGIRRLEREWPGLIPWAWAINISASVVSSILAVMLAMGLGFNLVSLIACACYLLAAASFPLLKKS